MSKNSFQQNLLAFTDWKISFDKRKKFLSKQKDVKKSTKVRYHPSLEYRDEE